MKQAAAQGVAAPPLTYATYKHVAPVTMGEITWTDPLDSDLQGSDFAIRNETPSRLLVAEGDFDGDGRRDEARLMVDRKNETYGLIVTLKGGEERQVLRSNPLRYLKSTGIVAHPPEEMVTACGKGFSPQDRKCERGVAKRTFKFDTISHYTFESAGGRWFWTGEKFEYDWDSD